MVDRRNSLRALANWIMTGSVVTGGFFLALLAWTLLRDESPRPFSWRLKNWWAAGGFCSIFALLLGYLILQVLAGGALTPKTLASTGAWIALLPFLLFGSCAGDAYQGASALGWIGPSTPRVATTVHKFSAEQGAWVRTGDGAGDLETWTEYGLVVSGDCCGEWEVPGRGTVVGDEVSVSEDVYDGHRVGSRISIVELPGARYPNLRLSQSVEKSTRNGLFFASIWGIASFAGLLGMRRQLVALSPSPLSSPD